MDMLPIVVYLEQDIVPVVQAIITSNFMKICLFVFLSVIICYLTLYVFAIFLLKKKENIENHPCSGRIKLLYPRRLFEAFSKIKIPDASVLFVPLFAGMFLIWIVFSLVMVGSHQSSNELGDAYGALNTLFSSLAFTAMIVALVLQGKEMRDQREELKSQGDTAKRARFENTFFNMLKNQREIINSLRYRPTAKNSIFIKEYEVRGVDVFKNFIENQPVFNFTEFPQRLDRDTYRSIIRRRIAKIRKMYSSIDDIYIFDSYFRNLYRILKFVNEATLAIDYPEGWTKKMKEDEEDKEKRRYTGILRAQLSTYELILLLYNSITPNYIEAKKMYVKFAFFDNIRFSLLPNAFLILSYPKEAFDIEKITKNKYDIYQAALYIADESPQSRHEHANITNLEQKKSAQSKYENFFTLYNEWLSGNEILLDTDEDFLD